MSASLVTSDTLLHCQNCVHSTIPPMAPWDGSQRLLSLFDSLGPIMSGPSSSHTAGMARIGRMGRIMLDAPPTSIELHFYGALSHTYKGHASDAALVAGLLGEKEDSPYIRSGLELARQTSTSVVVHTHPDDTRNPNTVRMLLSAGAIKYSITGISMGGGEILLTEVNGFTLELRGNEDGALLVETREDGAKGPAEFSAKQLESLFGPLRHVSMQQHNGKTMYICLADTPVKKVPKVLADFHILPLRNILGYKLVDVQPLFSSFAELEAAAEADSRLSLADMAVAYEMRRSGVTDAEVRTQTTRYWQSMQDSIKQGLSGNNDLLAGFVQRDTGMRLAHFVDTGNCLSGTVVGMAVARALAVMETNGSMHCIVAAPTAGACGVLPGALLSIAENRSLDTEQVVDALLAAALVGVLMAMRFPISGAMGGCQSEIGVASAMTAAGLCHAAGGTVRQCCHAAAMAMKNLLGLVCDPVAGPVEIPCIKRNAVGVANAFAVADMALAHIESAIPADEIISAVLDVQKKMHPDLRGNLKGSLAATPTGKKLKDLWYARMQHPTQVAPSAPPAMGADD